MRRRPHAPDQPALILSKPLSQPVGEIGMVLSGGGARAAYQVGALRALLPYLESHEHPLSVIVGSSIGAINGLVLGAGLKAGVHTAVEMLDGLWRERTFRNTFHGTPSQAFLRAIRMAVIQYMSPGPNPTGNAIFDPTPLMTRVDNSIRDQGGLEPEHRHPQLRAIGVMTTVEGNERKPLLFVSSHRRFEEQELTGASFEVYYVDSLSAKHGFASAALPSVLPPVELDTHHGKVRLVDGGISQNVPVDPAVRMGAQRVIVIDVSGRDWWLTRYGEAGDTRPKWEVPAGMQTFCMRPPDTFVSRCQRPLGPLLKEVVGRSSRKFIAAVGPTWPVFQLLRRKLGEEVAYEVMTYVALDPDYLTALIERGYGETRARLHHKKEVEFTKNDTFQKMVSAL